MPSIWNKSARSEMVTRHRKWPLGTRVLVKTHSGVMMEGKVDKHWRQCEVSAGCSILFAEVVDFDGLNWKRFSHIVPFRNLRKIL